MSIEAPKMPMMTHKTLCPKNDNQHCQKKKEKITSTHPNNNYQHCQRKPKIKKTH
jgi:hypothetical protein